MEYSNTVLGKEKGETVGAGSAHTTFALKKLLGKAALIVGTLQTVYI